MHANLISPSALGFVRVAVITPELRVADPTFNTSIINAALKRSRRARRATGAVP